jgi:hypothetical protein
MAQAPDQNSDPETFMGDRWLIKPHRILNECLTLTLQLWSSLENFFRARCQNKLDCIVRLCATLSNDLNY